MITAVDTSVLLDVLWEDPRFGRDSEHALATASREGRLVVCEVVFAELAGQFGDLDRLQGALGRAGITYSGMDAVAAATAGLVWRDYRRRGGPRERMVADFLIGAHALHQADRLLTRDRGFYRSYLPTCACSTPRAPERARRLGAFAGCRRVGSRRGTPLPPEAAPTAGQPSGYRGGMTGNNRCAGRFGPV